MNEIRRRLVVAACCSSLAAAAGAADTKAEGDLRWALNYCVKIRKDMERVRGQDPSAGVISNALERWQADYERYADYLGKARATDPSVTGSAAVYDRRTGQTFAQAHQGCLTLEADLQGFRTQADQKAATGQQKKAAEARQASADEARRAALEAATGAIHWECSGFKGRTGSSGIDERLAEYGKKKQEALAAWPDVVREPLTVNLVTRADAPGAATTKTVGEWFRYCDAMMPEHAAAIRKSEGAAAAREQQEAASRQAMNDRIRKEQAARYAELLAATGGDRRRVLQSKGFLPWWPRVADLRHAPVWKWEVNVTHEPTRCETYQFDGDRLVRNATELGACP